MCVKKAAMMQNLNSVSAFHHHCGISARKKKHPKMLLKLLGEMVPLVSGGVIYLFSKWMEQTVWHKLEMFLLQLLV